MIDITILPFALLAMRKQEVVERTVYKPSIREANDLSEKLKAFEKKEVNGRMQYPFELYLENKNIINFDKFGMIQVVNPFEYKRLIDVNGLRQWVEEQDMEKMFDAFPEEREIHQAKIQTMIQDCRAAFRKIGDKGKAR